MKLLYIFIIIYFRKDIFNEKRRRHRVFRAGIIVEMAGLLYDYDDEKLLKVLIENRYSIIK